MIHFRSLLSLGAIDDDEHIEPTEFYRIRSQQISKSTRLSQRKRKNKKRLESNTSTDKSQFVPPPLPHSYSTKQIRRQFFYPKSETITNGGFVPSILCEEKEAFDEILELDSFDHQSTPIDLELPMDSFYISSPSPSTKHMNIPFKPHINTTLPPPKQPVHFQHYLHKNLKFSLPPPLRIQSERMQYENTQIIHMHHHHHHFHTHHIVLNPNQSSNHSKNSNVSIKSMNSSTNSTATHRRISWSSQRSQSIPTQITQKLQLQTQKLNILHSPHLEQLIDDVSAQTDESDENKQNDNLLKVNAPMHLTSARSSRSFHDILDELDSNTRTMNENENEIEMELDVNLPFDYIENDEEESTNFNVLNRSFPSKHFKFMSNIGRGAYGVVDKCFYLCSCQIVALKKSRSPKKKMMDSLMREIEICKEFALNPYIINVIDYGMDKIKNEICIALEYMNGGSLLSMNHKFGLNEIRNICKCVLNALDALHSKLYVHNDVKPDNILWDTLGNVKLTDFGLIDQMKDVHTPLTVSCGSMYFQSYEKKYLSPIRYTTKSDIYSFGITICECLNNEYFEEEKEGKNEHNNTPYNIPLNVLNKYGDTQLIEFLNYCLEKNYNKRWSAEQLLKHSFLFEDEGENEELNVVKKGVNDTNIDDLEFMTEALISYYLRFNKEHMVMKEDEVSMSNRNSFIDDIYKKTPIDDVWTDVERLDNMARYCGYSVDAVQDFIFSYVNDVKNKYLKR